MLATAGWPVRSWEDLSSDYEGGHAGLCARISTRGDAIRALGGDAAVAAAETVYGGLLDVIRAGDLGGAIVRAAAV